MSTIKQIIAREILDSRGQPAIEGKLILANGLTVVSSSPSGTSVGKYEAVELRDNDPKRYNGQGVLSPVSYINTLISPKLVGVSVLKPAEIDAWLIKSDGTKDKSRLGANTILTVSQLVTRAAAASQAKPLYSYVNEIYQKISNSTLQIERIPTPLFNIINGGAHAHSNLEFQEFQIIPNSSWDFSKALQYSVEIYHLLAGVLIEKGAQVASGQEGGYTPSFPSNTDVLEILIEAINRRGLKPGLDVFLGLDIAATEFFSNDTYHLKDQPGPLRKDQYFTFIDGILKKYPLLSVEDPFAEDDFENWKKLTQSLSRETYVIGDDLIATNKDRLNRVIKEKAATSVLIKPNQIGTITETLEVIALARRSGLSTIVSHRSGETTDSFIADFAVGVQSDFVKFGAPARGERVVKYNRLLEIESEIKK